ncbi:N/A [soil metagenome]
MSVVGPVVVAILSHRDPAQVRRLVDRVLEGDNTVALVHHDPRGEPLDLEAGERTILLDNAEPADWGRMGLALAMLRCLQEARTRIPDMSWFLLVSGQDYPARPMRDIEAELAQTDTNAFLRHFWVTPSAVPGEDHWVTRCRSRYLRRIRLPGSHRSIPWPRRAPFDRGFGLVIGDMWVNLDACAVDHVLAQARRRPEVIRYLARCSIPDEALIPTLVLNDSDHLLIENDRRRHIAWTQGARSPQVLTGEAFDDIEASNAFFVRKVEPNQSESLMDELDRTATPRDPSTGPKPSTTPGTASRAR